MNKDSKLLAEAYDEVNYPEDIKQILNLLKSKNITVQKQIKHPPDGAIKVIEEFNFKVGKKEFNVSLLDKKKILAYIIDETKPEDSYDYYNEFDNFESSDFEYFVRLLKNDLNVN